MEYHIHTFPKYGQITVMIKMTTIKYKNKLPCYGWDEACSMQVPLCMKPYRLNKHKEVV